MVSRYDLLSLRACLAWGCLLPSRIETLLFHSGTLVTASTAVNGQGFDYDIDVKKARLWHVVERRVRTRGRVLERAKGESLPVQVVPLVEQMGTTNLPRGRVLLLRFANCTRKRITTYGYLDASPFVDFQVLQDSRWQDYSPGWCGTGAGNLIYEPGSSSLFWVDPPASNEVFKVGVEYHAGKETNTAWSKVIHWTADMQAGSEADGRKRLP
jgi:hypothetical protein